VALFGHAVAQVGSLAVVAWVVGEVSTGRGGPCVGLVSVCWIVDAGFGIGGAIWTRGCPEVSAAMK
jgi:hypothetical protein